jgi:hypothetical protein
LIRPCDGERNTHYGLWEICQVTRPLASCLIAAGFWSAVHARAEPPKTTEGAKPARQVAESDRLTEQRDKAVNVMRGRAKGTKVFVGENKSQAAELNQEPLLYFNNLPHRIVNGSLWGWSAGGRPVTLCKVEQYDRGRPDQTWLYCLASLSDKKIAVEFRDGVSWSAKTAGVEMRDLPDGPAPAEDARGRLRQMKDLARRFSATDFEPNGPGRSQLRLLPQPVWRYSDAAGGTVDGAIFATEGVAAVYLVELRQKRGQRPKWHYGVTAMDAWAVSIKLYDKEVWKKPFTPGPAPYENWIFRWERPAAAGD